MLEKTLEKPLDSKEIQPVLPKGISPEYSLEGLMQEKKEMTEDDMVGWLHYSMNMSLSKLWELVMDRGLACCRTWGCKSQLSHGDTTE